jgi:dynactin-6
MSSTKRVSTAKPAGPKPPVNFSSSLTISEKAVLQGTHSITIQAETVVHPGSKFESSVGSILIGRRCIIHERAHIGALPEDLDIAKPGGVSLGDYVIIEADVVVESGDTEIGDGSVIQVGCRVGTGAKIGKVSIRDLTWTRLLRTERWLCRTAP